MKKLSFVYLCEGCAKRDCILNCNKIDGAIEEPIIDYEIDALSADLNCVEFVSINEIDT